MRQALAAAVAALAAALTLAACSGGTPARSTAPMPSVRPSSRPPAPSPSPGPSGPPRLTIKQAAAAYLRIADPVTRAAAAVNADFAAHVPFSQLRRDELAYAAAVARADRRSRAIRWPAQVEGYITSMMLAYYPANRECARAVAAAGSNSAAARVFHTNEVCVESQDTSNLREVRALLHLPPMAG